MKRPTLVQTMRNRIFYSIVALASLTGCQNGTIYHPSRPTEEIGWSIHDSLFYTIPTYILPSSCKLNIGIRHTETYPYKDLWIEVGSKESIEKKDTFHLYLADQDGHWTSNTTGRLYQCNFDEGKLNLSIKDSTLYVVHLMTDTLLRGIHDVGIQLSLTSSIDTKKYKK